MLLSCISSPLRCGIVHSTMLQEEAGKNDGQRVVVHVTGSNGDNGRSWSEPKSTPMACSRPHEAFQRPGLSQAPSMAFARMRHNCTQGLRLSEIIAAILYGQVLTVVRSLNFPNQTRTRACVLGPNLQGPKNLHPDSPPNERTPWTLCRCPPSPAGPVLRGRRLEN